MPVGVEVESMRYIVVYDSSTSSLQGSGELNITSLVTDNFLINLYLTRKVS